MKYKILFGFSIDHLSNEIERYLNQHYGSEGRWKLHGGLVVIGSDHRITFYQVIVRDDQ